MNSALRRPNHFVTGVLVLIMGFCNALIISHLKQLGVSTETILMIRGGTCAVIVALISILQARSLVPRSPSVQFARGIVAGTSLFLATASYRYLHPSSATLLGRLDLPLLGLLTSRGNSQSFLPRFIGFFSIAWLFCTAVAMRDPSEQLVGYICACLGGILVSVGYLFVHRTSRSENWLVVAFTPALACFLIGGAAVFVNSSFSSITFSTFLELIVSGSLMFSLYFAIGIRHKNLSAFYAEWPAVFIPLALLSFDVLILQKTISSTYIAAISVAVALVTLQLVAQRKNKT